MSGIIWFSKTRSCRKTNRLENAITVARKNKKYVQHIGFKKRVPDTPYVSGYKLLPEAECSNCHNIVNMQKPMCPYCGYTMVNQREKHLSD